MTYEVGQWVWYTPESSEGQIVKISDLWGRVSYQVWLPTAFRMQWCEQAHLIPLGEQSNLKAEPFRISYLAAATKIAQILEGASSGELLISPMQSNVIPLPHQIAALKKVLSSSPPRYMLADEVGLGKTIEAGLVLKELKLRGLAKRILIVVPKGLAKQWQSEMRIHFNEEFQMINGDDIPNLDRLFASEGGAWKIFDQVLVSLDSIKPIDRRKGWTKERVAAYNKSRLENLVQAGWDLIIIDEAHRIGGSTEQVARYKLGKVLSEVAPNLLLLTATPHQGKSDAFFRLLNILDPQAFPDETSVSKQTVERYLVRTEKRNALDQEGHPLFQSRSTSMVPVSWGIGYDTHRQLYEEVSEYVREGYNKAIKNKKPHIGFLMVLIQRLVTSSTMAVKTTLERRLEVLKDIQDSEPSALLNLFGEEVEELDGEEQQELLVVSPLAMSNEIKTVEFLITLATRCANEREDAKTVALRNLITQLEQQERDPKLKVLVFTEFVPTQAMLQTYFEQRGFKVAVINGSMGREERQLAQDEFADDARLLISTDAGGEGLNLQFAHIVVNYDLPWNPMKIEQRIGRVDRIGQAKPVSAYNFLLKDSVEYRVIEVLEQKLKIVASELGVDKTSDVLESSDSSSRYQQALTMAIMNPMDFDNTIDDAINDIKTSNMVGKEGEELLSYIQMKPGYEDVRPIVESPLPLWTENLVLSYIKFQGGSVAQSPKGLTLNWPDGTIQRNVGFHHSDRATTTLTTADEQVMGLVRDIPKMYSGTLVPRINVPGLPDSVSGLWGVFECRLHAGVPTSFYTYLRVPEPTSIFLPIFLSKEGKQFTPTAQRIWHLLALSNAEMIQYLDADRSIQAMSQMVQLAEGMAENKVEEYRIRLEQLIDSEVARLGALEEHQHEQIKKAGLKEVRNHRQARLALFNEEIQDEIKQARIFYPELSCMLLVSIGEQDD